MTTQTARATLLALCAALLASGFAHATESQRVEGEYMSGYQDNERPLEAVFTPTGTGLWGVVFHFTFNGAEHEYAGTAEGSLNGGELRGEVKNESKQRTFTFRVAHRDDGTLRGRHAERHRGRETDTGTLVLRLKN